MELYMGIDVGAINTKMVLYSPGGSIVSHLTRGTTVDLERTARSMKEEIMDGYDISDLKCVVSTGQGRRAVGFSDLSRTEITSFARGAFEHDPSIDIAVDMGGHGVRVMRMGEMGIITDFRTNDKCSSGTGCFIDATARALNVDHEKAGEISLMSCSPERVNNTCTVFAESEVVSMVAKGKKKEDILAGLNEMVARRIGALVNSMRSEGRIMFGGGVANNAGVVSGLRKVIDREIVVPEHPELVGAFGAALLSPGLHRAVPKGDGELAVKRSLWDRILGVK